ncbi:MAG: hypothetical protein PHY12_13265 [Eubacteriales bacterium]|nr:hypothetical protein [Eubacteriales bacterium]
MTHIALEQLHLHKQLPRGARVHLAPEQPHLHKQLPRARAAETSASRGQRESHPGRADAAVGYASFSLLKMDSFHRNATSCGRCFVWPEKAAIERKACFSVPLRLRACYNKGVLQS